MPKDTHMRHVRPHRISVPNNEQAIIALGSERISGTLCKLSVTGGSLRLAKQFPPGTLADITLRTTSGNVGAVVQFLRNATGAPDVQAFRFFQIDPAARRHLERTLERMRQQGFGEKRRGLTPLVDLAQRAFTSAKRKIAP
jgi:PilZ domain